MAASKETVTTKVVVQPEWDRRAVKKMTEDWAKTQKKLASVKMDWGQISKGSSSAVKEIAKIAKAADAMSGSLSAATKASVKNMAALAKQLQETKKRAEELKRKASTAGSKEDRASAETGAAEAEKQMMVLTKQLRDNRKAERQHLTEIKESIKARKLERDQLKKAAAYTGKDFKKDFGKNISGAFGSMKAGGPKNVWNALKSAGGGAKAGSKFSAGVSARASLSGEGGMMAGLSKLTPLLSGLTVGFAAFIGFIAKASSAITTMNKTLIEGSGTANDFTSKTGAYASAIDDLRVASKDATGNLLTMGGTVEGTSKMINSYMKEASGSVIKTRDAMLTLGKGDTAKGVEMLAKNAIMYGKALGMEATEVGTMMGQMEQEVGLGAGQTQKVMGDIVKMAATSNMPVSKFMGIFKAVTPDLELYINRIEELSGIVKLLSKNMSAADVKQFMDAFSKGFQGKSFTDRVQTMVAAQAGGLDVSKTLKEDFSKKADVIAESLGAYGKEWREAFKVGDKASMQTALIKAKAGGANGATIGQAQNLMGAESDRKQGQMGVASAMKGAGMWTTIKTLLASVDAKVGKNAGQGERISGFRELAAEQNFSGDQQEAMNKFLASMELYTKSIKDYGSTGSKSMDKALAAILSQDKSSKAYGMDPADVLKDRALMTKASQDQIAAASENSVKEVEVQQTAEDLAREQTDATMSLGDKLDNVISYILEQIYESVNGVLKVLNNIFNAIVDFFSGRKSRMAQNAAIDQYSVKGYGKSEQAGFDRYKGALKTGADAGDMSGAAGKFYAQQYKTMKQEAATSLEAANNAKSPEEKEAALASAQKSLDAATALKEAVKKILPSSGVVVNQRTGMVDQAATDMAKAQNDAALEAGNFEDAFKKANFDSAKLLTMGQDLISKSLTNADKSGAGPMRRAGKSEAVVQRGLHKDPNAAAEISDNADPALFAKKLTEGVEKEGGITATVETKDKPAAMAAAASSSSDVQDKQAKSFAKELVANSKGPNDDIKKSTDDVYDGVHDVTSLLKKGIRYEPGFLTGPYSKAIRDSTLLSFQDALMEFGILQAKMAESPGIRRMMSDQGMDIMAQGGGINSVNAVDTGSSNAYADWQKNQTDQTKSKLTGGPIPDTGMYKLHRGEYVMPAVGAGGGGGGSVNATVHIHGSTLGQKQLEHAVFNAMDRLAKEALMPVRLPGVDNPAIPDAFTAQASRGGRPFLFQIMDVMNQPLYPYLLAAHVNPSDFNEGHTKSKNVVMTYGGFVEFNWPDELTSLSATSSTGAFLGPGTGLVSGSDGTGGSFGRPSLAAGGPGRHATMAWERQEDLLELFHSNGVIFNGRGQPVLRGRVMVIYDRGIFYGSFARFEVKETDEKAFTFDLSWEFNVEEVLYTFPGSATRAVFPSNSRSSGITLTPDQVAQQESDLVAGRGDFVPNGGPVPQTAAVDDAAINQALFPGAGG